MYSWPIVASATVAGSTASFVCCRFFFRDYVNRLVEKDTRFAALALTVKHDGLKLLILMRLCPLPYSISNGAISTIPTVTWLQFATATAIVTPKLLVHVFLGSKFAELAEHGEEMDFKTKLINYLWIAMGSIIGMATAWIIYQQTKKRAAELEAQERENGGHTNRDQLPNQYADDPDALEAAEFIRDDDDISLRDGDEWLGTEHRDDADNHFSYRDQSPSPLLGSDEGIKSPVSGDGFK